MPEGLPPTCSSIQVRSISSCLGVWATAPSTPKPPALVTAATTSRQWLKARIGYSTPNMSATAVFICIDPLLCGASERDRHAARAAHRSEEHTSELQSLMRISYAVFCLKKKKIQNKNKQTT